MKRFPVIVLSMALLFSLVMPTAVFAESSDFRSGFGAESCNLVEYMGAGGDVFIPEGFTRISDFAFEKCKEVTSVTIPNSVTTIAYCAFVGCTGLKNITIPDSVTFIGASAFSGCTSLTDITLPNGISEIDNDLFRECTSLTNITIPNSITTIESLAFLDCTSLSTVNIPDGVTFIGEGAFKGCTSLTNITIPDSVTWVASNAFEGSGIPEREIDDIYEQVEQNTNKPVEEERALLEEITEDSNVSSQPVSQVSSEMAPTQSEIKDDRQVIGSASPNKDKSGGLPLFVIVLVLILLAGVGVAVYLIKFKKKPAPAIKVRCLSCNTLCDENAKFCPECGGKIGE